MSNLSSGDQPKGKGPNPRRRRRKKPADKQQQAMQGLAVNVAVQNISPPEVSHDGKQLPFHENKDGSDIGNSTYNAEAKQTTREGVVVAPVKDGRSQLLSGDHKKLKQDANLSKTEASDTQAVEASARPNNSPRLYNQYGNRRRRPNAYAALDLGTNNCRLLIAVPQAKGGFRVIDGFSKIVRLGEGLSQTGKLSQEAMDRSVEALKVCAGKLKNRSIKRQRLIATEACRQALNGEEFLARVKAESGLDLEIVSRESEARLATEGCGSLMDRKSDAAVLFDIGGGSSELILVNNVGARKKKISERIVAWTSLPMGVVTLAERFGGQNVSRKLFDEMVQDVMQHIDAFEGKEALAKVFAHGRVHLLGTSGTVTTLAGIHLKLPRYDRKRVDGIWLKDEEVDKVIDELLSMSYEQRASNPCIGNERADLVLAGCAILNAIRLTWPSKRLRVADRGLREGLLSEMMALDGIGNKNRRGKRFKNKRREGGNRKPNPQQTNQNSPNKQGDG